MGTGGDEEEAADASTAASVVRRLLTRGLVATGTILVGSPLNKLNEQLMADQIMMTTNSDMNKIHHHHHHHQPDELILVTNNYNSESPIQSPKFMATTPYRLPEPAASMMRLMLSQHQQLPDQESDPLDTPLSAPTTSGNSSTWSLLMGELFHYSNVTSTMDPSTFDGSSDTITTSASIDHINWPNFILAVFLILLMLTTSIGNLFVIVAILIERNLRTIGNYLVLSLAIADLLVACLVMPLAGIYQILDRWTLGVILCDLWTSMDVFCCTASILHLLAIALDRYWAVTRVDYIRCQRNHKRILFMIAFVWMAAIVVSVLPAFGLKDAEYEIRITQGHECLISQDIGYQIFATCTTFYFPLTLTLIFYWKIYQVARKRIRRKPGNRVKVALQHPSTSSSNSQQLATTAATSATSAKLKKQQSCGKPTDCQESMIVKAAQSGARYETVLVQSNRAAAVGACDCLCHHHHNIVPANKVATASPGKLLTWAPQRVASPAAGEPTSVEANGSRRQSSSEPSNKRDQRQQQQNTCGPNSAAQLSGGKRERRSSSSSSSITSEVQSADQRRQFQPLGCKETNASAANGSETLNASGGNGNNLPLIAPKTDDDNDYRIDNGDGDGNDMDNYNHNYNAGQTDNRSAATAAPPPVPSIGSGINSNSIGTKRAAIATSDSLDAHELSETNSAPACSKCRSNQKFRCRCGGRQRFRCHSTATNERGANNSASTSNVGVAKLRHNRANSGNGRVSSSSRATFASISVSMSENCEDLADEEVALGQEVGDELGAGEDVDADSSCSPTSSLATTNCIRHERGGGGGGGGGDDLDDDDDLDGESADDDECCACCCSEVEQVAANLAGKQHDIDGPESQEQKVEILCKSHDTNGQASEGELLANRAIALKYCADADTANAETSESSSQMNQVATSTSTRPVATRVPAASVAPPMGPQKRDASFVLTLVTRLLVRLGIAPKLKESKFSACQAGAPLGSTTNGALMEVVVDGEGKSTLLGACKSCQCANNLQGSRARESIEAASSCNMLVTDQTSELISLADEGPRGTDTGGILIAASTANIAANIATVRPTAATAANSLAHARNQREEGVESRRERKAAKTLAIITGVFVMCWLPFFIMAIAMPLLNLKPLKYQFAVLQWLGYANSMLNPIIYTIFSPDFRKAFKRLLCGSDAKSNKRKQRQNLKRQLQQQHDNYKQANSMFITMPDAPRGLAQRVSCEISALLAMVSRCCVQGAKCQWDLEEIRDERRRRRSRNGTMGGNNNRTNGSNSDKFTGDKRANNISSAVASSAEARASQQVAHHRNSLTSTPKSNNTPDNQQDDQQLLKANNNHHNEEDNSRCTMDSSTTITTGSCSPKAAAISLNPMGQQSGPVGPPPPQPQAAAGGPRLTIRNNF